MSYVDHRGSFLKLEIFSLFCAFVEPRPGLGFPTNPPAVTGRRAGGPQNILMKTNHCTVRLKSKYPFYQREQHIFPEIKSTTKWAKNYKNKCLSGWTNAKLHYIWSKFYKYNEILFPMRWQGQKFLFLMRWLSLTRQAVRKKGKKVSSQSTYLWSSLQV